MTAQEPRWTIANGRDEFTNRSMDRLLATATYGPQPDRGTRQTEISVPAKRGGRVSVAFTLKDTEAIFGEFELGAPCGICHEDPCTYGRKS